MLIYVSLVGKILVTNNNMMFRGKTKKVKKYREEGEAYRGGRNPFQVSLNHQFLNC